MNGYKFCKFGLVSYRLTIWSSDCVYVRQAVTLTPGKSYTLSGYVRSGGPRGVMRVAYTVGNETFTLDSEPGKVWEKTDNMPYERVSVSFTLPENAEPKVYCMAYCDTQNGFKGGNCWFDAMQLEEGLTLNHFNMIQNSDFSAVGTDGKPKAWTVGNNSNSYVSVLPLDDKDDIFHAPDCLKHDNTQKIHLLGRYDRTVTYYQQFRHYGKIGDDSAEGDVFMTVSSTISVFCRDGVFRTVYCHLHGEPTWNGRILHTHYATGQQAEALVEHGDIRCLGPRCDKPAGHTLQNPVDGVTAYYGRDSGFRMDSEAREYRSFREAIATESTEEVRFHYVFIDGYWKVMYRTPEGWKMKALALALRRCPE